MSNSHGSRTSLGCLCNLILRIDVAYNVALYPALWSSRRLKTYRIFLSLLCAFSSIAALSSSGLTQELHERQGTLNQWHVSIDGGKSFQKFDSIGSIEDKIDPNFDGVSIYKSVLPNLKLGDSDRLIVKFEGVATHAKVFVSEELVGEHLGAWTPFLMDITNEYLGGSKDTDPVELKVVVDEMVGHNTQGFLPIVTNHFGGIWKPVTWEIEGVANIVEHAVSIRLDREEQILELEVPVYQKIRSLLAVNQKSQLRCGIRELEPWVSQPTSDWQELEIKSFQAVKENGDYVQSASDGFSDTTFHVTLSSPQSLKPWSPDSPQRYEFRIGLLSNSSGDQELLDEFQTKIGFRKFETNGSRFLLNGQPTNIRGLLNWGYAPPSMAPSLDESWMRRELQIAKQRGFNMMKFCLWVPPKRYLELCDEMGMLAWMEYPTWHPKLDADHLPELRREYAEFFRYDRNHASVVLRSLTCETGPSAELAVIQSLYDQCKSFIPDAVLEDDSSWIGWNRVHDFYDDHPYGNNHTWVATLERLKKHISDRELKPLMLGEAIAADTWVVPDGRAQELTRSAPHHGPMAIVDAKRWQNQIARVAAARGRSFHPSLLKPQSRHYGMLMRKYQIEAYQREVPDGGYVVSVIRDFRKAHMGLVDFFDNPKHTTKDWSFQNERMILLQTSGDKRSFESGLKVDWKLIVKNRGAAIGQPTKLEFRLKPTGHSSAYPGESILQTVPALPAGDRFAFACCFELPDVEKPTRCLVNATWQVADKKYENEWPVWIIPRTEFVPEVIVHPSAAALMQPPINARPLDHSKIDSTTPILTRILDTDILRRLDAGCAVLMIPNGQRGSFPIASHWFLRGSPVVLQKDNEPWNIPISINRNGVEEQHNMLVELQHFDLAGDVISNIDHYLENIDPVVLLWDNHDRDVVNTHGLVFKMPVGAGNMCVSSLNHWDNAAGKWLLSQLIGDLENMPRGAERTGKPNLQRLSRESNRKEIDLVKLEWKFLPDPGGNGHQLGWYRSEFNDQNWKSISIDRHWEGQGYAALDNWAWYRNSIALPDDWASETTYLNFTGIDDYADIYVNGEKVGSAGDMEKRQTAFEDRLSFDISQHAEPGATMQIAIAVYDWYGAGGIFRPVTISTSPLSDNRPILK